MFGFLDAPDSFLALLGAWFFAQVLFGWAFGLVKELLDAIFADSMPRPTADVVRGLITQHGLDDDVTLARGPRHMDAFFPLTGVILIDGRTYAKEDPIFWAIGLHEFGHALVHRVPVLGWIFGIARQVWLTLAPVQRVLLFGLLVYGGGLFPAALGWTLLIGLGAGALVLLDELAASIISMLKLRATGELHAGQMIGAGVGLLVALASYAGTMAADALLLLHLQEVTAMAAKHATTLTPSAMGWPTRIVLGVATLPAVVIGLVGAIAVLASPKFWLSVRESAAQVGAAIIVALTWQRAHTPLGQLLCALALLVATGGFFQLLTSPLGFVLRRLPGFARWAAARVEEATVLGEIALIQLDRSWAMRLSQALPWFTMVAYVGWYWLAS